MGGSASEQAERLLWRAGFGPRKGEAAKLARKGLDRAVESLTRPKAERLTGPPPKDDDGRPLAPFDAYGHNQLWWLDKMVRTNRPLDRADDARLARLVRDLAATRSASRA